MLKLPRVKFCSLVLKQCWNCDENLSLTSAFCNKCNKLQPLNPDYTHFEVLGIERNFSIDTVALVKTYRNLQGRFHPDRYSTKSEQEQQFAVEHSSAINKAYRCLLHPVERALYLLELADQPLHEGQIDMEPAFLMEIMEVNEELAEAEDKETVQAIGQRNQEILKRLLRDADAAFSAGNTREARSVVAKIKYYNNVYEKVREYEREHGILD
ncbi:hypothetical protein Pmani_028106 [Petrolisthes manimaculis]|uniref:J domain-containing protein n=1 Tax=Petrolisthes manimaculis TaxID=1843537 RepID=A0AAE1P2V0_9EUCA|nr:hypothetical protein Pmani_028106 [Petrolisthes manimaculis]